jgi:hypothetical protein
MRNAPPGWFVEVTPPLSLEVVEVFVGVFKVGVWPVLEVCVAAGTVGLAVVVVVGVAAAVAVGDGCGGKGRLDTGLGLGVGVGLGTGAL